MEQKAKAVYLNAREITIIALLGAVASILMFLNFPLPIFPSFVKMDISDAPALIASLAIGPHAGVLVGLIKNIVNLTHTSTGGVGELANFTIGCAFTITAGVIYRRRHTMRGALIGMAAGVVMLTVTACIANYYVLLPLYSRLVPMDVLIGMYRAINPYADTLPKVILTCVAPFNFIKGSLVALLTFSLYKRISPVIKGR